MVIAASNDCIARLFRVPMNVVTTVFRVLVLADQRDEAARGEKVRP